MYREEVSAGLVPEIVAPDFEAHRVRIAVGGFLAGYSGMTRDAYALDLRQWVAWCAGHDLEVFAVRRAHIELFARFLGRRARREPRSLGACRQSPASTSTALRRSCWHIRRRPTSAVPRSATNRTPPGWIATSLACSWFRPVSVGAGTMPWRACWR